MFRPLPAFLILLVIATGIPVSAQEGDLANYFGFEGLEVIKIGRNAGPISYTSLGTSSVISARFLAGAMLGLTRQLPSAGCVAMRSIKLATSRSTRSGSAGVHYRYADGGRDASIFPGGLGVAG